jgi:hypothetical protein
LAALWFFEIARVLVRLDDGAGLIVNANHGIIVIDCETSRSRLRLVRRTTTAPLQRIADDTAATTSCSGNASDIIDADSKQLAAPA